MLKKLYLFLFTILAINGLSQTIQINGQILDSEGYPVPGARYFLSSKPGSIQKTSTDGKYKVSYDMKKNDTLILQHFGFEEYRLVVTKRMEKKALRNNNVLNYDIELSYLTFDPIVVRPSTPDTVFGTQEYSVADFEFDNAGNTVLLTYEKTLAKGSVLRLLDSANKIIDRYYIPDDAVELRTDFRNNIHLITEDRVYLVMTRENQFNVFLEDRDYYFKFVAPIVDTIGDNIYYSNYSEIYPAFDYYEFNRKDSVYRTLLEVEDSSMMEFYRAEFKYVDVRTKLWAHHKQLQTGIDKEVWVGATVFANSIYYEPLYAPLFRVGEDTLFVFDHYKNQLFKYTCDEGFVDSLRIYYHRNSRKSGWEQPLIQDEANDKIYGMFLRNGYTYLSEINQRTGQITESFKLHYKYVEKIKIIGDQVYYIYRPFESVQKKYIYREKLKVAN